MNARNAKSRKPAARLDSARERIDQTACELFPRHGSRAVDVDTVSTRSGESRTSTALLLDSQRRVLERIASGAPLSEILVTLVRLIEEQAGGMRCAVLLADPMQQRLTFVAAPSIPADYKSGIEPYLRIAPNMGSCGTAAFLRKPVYTEDTATDSLWENCRGFAVRNGLRAIWSTPILSDDNDVLGTFAMYYGEPRLPSAEDIQLIDMATQMARVAIQREQDEERLRASEEKFRLIAENARDLIVLVDSRGRRLYLSPSYRMLYGDVRKLHGENALDSVYPEDRARIEEAFGKMIRSGVGGRHEYRVRSISGELRYLQWEGTPIRDSSGQVTAALGVGRDITEQRRTQEALHRSAEELQALSRRLVELQESERRELASGLHDRVGQSLTALNINLAILRETLPRHDTDISSRLDDSAILLESIVRAIENVVSDLRPPMLDDHGLPPALEWYAKQFSARAGIAVSVRASEPDERIAADVEIALFRIVQEALNNVAKHARASSVEIALECEGSEYVMSVVDNGVGLRAGEEGADRPRPGLGMVTMRERAQAVGGRFQIESLPCGGTQLTVRCPK
jgi:PAS domain S-box-containing protein